jgi:hypothetical protein
VETASSEYGLEIRALAVEALRKGAPGSARDAAVRAVAHAREVLGHVRDARLVALFLRRPFLARLVAEAELCGVPGAMDTISQGAARARDGRAGPVPSRRREVDGGSPVAAGSSVTTGSPVGAPDRGGPADAAQRGRDSA